MISQYNHTPPRILIVGGGVAGLELATLLGRKLGRKNLADITLIDSKMSYIWKPLLHEVAAGTLNASADEINYIIQGCRNGFKFRPGTLADINRTGKTVTIKSETTLSPDCLTTANSLSYDYLIIAIGSRANIFNTQGVMENALFLDSREQAEIIRSKLLSFYFKFPHKDPYAPKKPIQLAIIGAGATGVELAAELHHSGQLLSHYGLQKGSHLKISLIEGADRILPALPERISQPVAKYLTEKNISLFTSTRVTCVNSSEVITRQHGHLPADLTIWTAGVSGPAILKNIAGLKTSDNNQLLVRPTLQTSLDDYIFALGDCADLHAVNSQGKKVRVPPRAQAAHQQAKFLALALSQKILHKKEFGDFIYRDYGSLISLSQHSAVGELIGGLKLEGIAAKLAYASLYRSHQMTVHGKLRTLMLILRDLVDRGTQSKIKLH